MDFVGCVLMGTFGVFSGSCASVSRDLSQWLGKIEVLLPFSLSLFLVMFSDHWIMVFRQNVIYEASLELGMQSCGNFWPSFFYLANSEMPGVRNHIGIIWCWGSDSGFPHVRQALRQ